jgi:hypothetical protein
MLLRHQSTVRHMTTPNFWWKGRTFDDNGRVVRDLLHPHRFGPNGLTALSPAELNLPDGCPCPAVACLSAGFISASSRSRPTCTPAAGVCQRAHHHFFGIDADACHQSGLAVASRPPCAERVLEYQGCVKRSLRMIIVHDRSAGQQEMPSPVDCMT